MRTAYNPGAAAGAALVTAALIAAAGCGSLDRSVSRDHCLTSSDCNRGRVCVAGICQAPTSAAADAPVDAPKKDEVPGVDAGADVAADLPVAGEAGADAPRDSGLDLGVDSADAFTGGDDAGGDDAGGDDAGADTAVDTGTTITPPPDPCTTGPGQESPAATPILLAALPGLWRLCPTNVAIDSDVSWLVGSRDSIQLDALHWWHCTSSGPPSCDLMAQGMYFRVLEGSNSVFHFAEQQTDDPFNGDGADISIHYFAGSKLLQISACDGAARCSSRATYLVPVGSGN